MLCPNSCVLLKFLNLGIRSSANTYSFSYNNKILSATFSNSSHNNNKSKKIPKPIEIPKGSLKYSYSRSSGPGGQNVNKKSTKVEIRFNILEAHWIPDDVKKKFIIQNKSRILEDNTFIMTNQSHRTQWENRNSCYKELKKLINEANFTAHGLVGPKERKIQRIRRTKSRSRRKNLMKAEKSGMKINEYSNTGNNNKFIENNDHDDEIIENNNNNNKFIENDEDEIADDVANNNNK